MKMFVEKSTSEYIFKTVKQSTNNDIDSDQYSDRGNKPSNDNISSTKPMSQIINWVIDSGATKHVTDDRTISKNYVNDSTVFTGYNNTTSTSHVKGDVDIEFTTEIKGKWYTTKIKLHDVMYVPDAYNLISIWTLLDNLGGNTGVARTFIRLYYENDI